MPLGAPYLYLGEPVGVLRWLGTIIVVIGTILIGVSARQSAPAMPPDAAERVSIAYFRDDVQQKAYGGKALQLLKIKA